MNAQLSLGGTEAEMANSLSPSQRDQLKDSLERRIATQARHKKRQPPSATGHITQYH
jgi:hypothetical protein